MSANITDKFTKASDMSGDYPFVATVTAARVSGATVLVCDDLTGWATDTAVHFSTFQVDANGNVDGTTQTDWKGVVSGNTITDLTRVAGAADSGSTPGDRVELNPTIGWVSDLMTGLLNIHNQDGSLKNGVIQPTKFAAGAVPVITMQTTDPGEGVALAANNFIAVYEA